MKAMMVAVTIAALVMGGSTGCSSDPPAKPKRGVLPAGTAHLTIEGADAGTTGAVNCSAAGSQTTIRTGDGNAGVTVGLSQKERLTVDFVRIRNINGFSGDYNLGLGNEASAAVTDSTYHITGTALGYRSPDAIAPTTQQFAIAVTC